MIIVTNRLQDGWSLNCQGASQDMVDHQDRLRDNPGLMQGWESVCNSEYLIEKLYLSEKDHQLAESNIN